MGSSPSFSASSSMTGSTAKVPLGLARGPVGLDLLLVADDVVAVNQLVFDVVLAGGGHGAAADGGAGEGPGLEGHVEFYGGNLSGVGGADLAALEGRRGGAGALEDLFAVHDDFHRAAALAGQDRGRRLQVAGQLGAEPAADFGGYDLDHGFGQAQDGCRGGANAERTLGAGPDGHPALGRPDGRGGVGFDVSLVDRLGLELTLDYHVGLGKALLDVAQLVLDVAGDVALDPGVLAPGEAGHPEMGSHVVVEDGGVVVQGVVQGQHGGQHFVVHFDELGRLVGDVGVDGGYRGDGVALVEEPFPGP